MNNKKTVLVILVLVLFVSNIFFVYKYQGALRQVKVASEQKKTNEKVVDFLKVFIAKVLKAKQEVSFEERLTLENAVRDLGDAEILNQWKKFTESKTEPEAQGEVKNLLELLTDKVNVQ